MFPHEFDRYRLMALLLRQARQSIRRASAGSKKPRTLTQTGLAELVNRASRLDGISQPTISNLEGLDSLTRSYVSGVRPGTRETLIEICTLGLKLNQLDVDALLWLFDLSTLDEYEISYCEKYEANSFPGKYSENQLRTRILQSIDEWLLKTDANSARNVEARLITEWDETGQLKFQEELFRMEDQPGQRMVFGKHPSVLTYPHSLKDLFRTEPSVPNYLALKAEALINRRRELFVKNLSLFGERSIHSRKRMMRYLSGSYDHILTVEQRKEQIRNLINLLRAHKHYQLGFVDFDPSTEVELKSTVAACLRAADRDTYRKIKKGKICGPLYIYLYDVTSVFSFYRQFERCWDSIIQEYRDKASVINFLNRILDAAK